MLDFHWIQAMLFYRKYYDFLQLFLHHGIFLPAILSAVVFFRNSTAGGKIPCLKIDVIKNSSILYSDALWIYLQVMITTDIL